MKMKAMVNYDADLQNETIAAIQELFAYSKQPINRQQTILVASLVNIDNLTSSSTFGRTISQYINSWLVQNDYTTIEMKLSSSVYFKQRGGTFFLSRDIKKINQRYEAQAVIVGTYAVADSTCIISFRLIQASSGKIFSAVDFLVPLGSETKKMLGFHKN